MVLKSLPPRDVIHLLDVVTVGRKSSEELVHAKTGVASYVGNGKRGLRREDGARNNDASNVINRNHVDGIVDVGHLSELSASLNHTKQEIVGVGDASLRMASDVTGTNDGSGEAASTSGADDVFGRPLALAVSGGKPSGRSHKIIRFGNTSLAGGEAGVGKGDVVIGIDDGGGGNKGEGLRTTGRAEVEAVEGSLDVGAMEAVVILEPMDLITVKIKMEKEDQGSCSPEHHCG